MKEIIMQLLAAFVGSMGFALIFGMKRRYLFCASLGALLGWAFAVSYSEIMAKLLKTPATLFVIPAIIPLVPGGSLYYTMSYAVHRDMENARLYGTRTAETALAIAAGISFVLAVRELRSRR